MRVGDVAAICPALGLVEALRRFGDDAEAAVAAASEVAANDAAASFPARALGLHGTEQLLKQLGLKDPNDPSGGGSGGGGGVDSMNGQIFPPPPPPPPAAEQAGPYTRSLCSST
jgi:hypothetical protein